MIVVGDLAVRSHAKRQHRNAERDDDLDRIAPRTGLKGVPIDDCPPAILEKLEDVCPIPGLTGQAAIAGLVANAARAMGVAIDTGDFSVG
jgi:hypothetical protein